MSDFTIEQLESLKEDTTPGPWEATKDDILRAGWRDRLLEKCPWYAEDEWEDEISYMAPGDEFVLSNPEPDYKPLTDNRADMELVASAPGLLDALITEKRAHQRIRAELEAVLDTVRYETWLHDGEGQFPEAVQLGSYVAGQLARILEGH